MKHKRECGSHDRRGNSRPVLGPDGNSEFIHTLTREDLHPLLQLQQCNRAHLQYLLHLFHSRTPTSLLLQREAPLPHFHAVSSNSSLRPAFTARRFELVAYTHHVGGAPNSGNHSFLSAVCSGGGGGSYHLWDEETEPLFFCGAEQTRGERQSSVANSTNDSPFSITLWLKASVQMGWKFELAVHLSLIHIRISTQRQPPEHRQQGKINVSVLLKKKSGLKGLIWLSPKLSGRLK